MNIFEILNERYVLPNKPKLFEAFSGIGCQRMAFNRLGIDYESVGISEIDKYAIQSYMAIHGDTKNFGSICDIKGTDLPQIDVFTWSFPCTDLSKAGKQKGLTNTRSGLVYEVLRILQECKLNGNLPKVLIMENVVDLIQVKFIREFQSIQLELEQLGYSNYTQTLNAKDYGVAQNRDRVFMVSILGDYYFEFPKPIKLEKRLKDYLESEVDPKYYLSDKFIQTMLSDESGKFNRSERFQQSTHSDLDNAIGFAITTRAGSRPTDNFVKVVGNINPSGKGMNGNVFSGNIAPTLTTNKSEGIKVIQKERGYNKGSELLHCPSITSNSWHENNYLKDDYIIRKLIPLECYRLMGIDDKDFYKAQQVCSNAQLYKQAGNGIVVDVFAAIISTMQGEQK